MSDKLDPEETVSLRGELEERFAPAEPSVLPKRTPGERSLGKYAFPLMLLGGLAILGLYGALKAVSDPSSIIGITHNPTFTSIFTDPVRLGIVALMCLIPATIVRRRRSRQSRILQI